MASPLLAVRVRWDAPTTNTDGTPLTDLAAYRVSIIRGDEDANAGGTLLYQRRVFVQKADLTEALSNLPPGQYKIQVQAIDYSGNESAWSDPVSVDTRDIAASPPTNLRTY